MAARKSLFPLFLLFVSINGLSILFRRRLEPLGFDVNLLIVANLILCALTFVSFYILYKGMKASTTAGFLKSVYGSFLLKLILVAGLVFGYVMTNRDGVNKPSLIASMFLYLVYTFVETRSLLKISRRKEHA
jgi:H+/gluconate symporter-like permease